MEGYLLSPNGISTILFDLDGTLRHSRPSFTQTFIDFIVKIGAPYSAEGRRRSLRWLHYYWAQSPEMLQDRQTFGEQKEAFWTNHGQRYLVAFGLPSELAVTLAPDMYAYIQEEYKPEDWVPQDVPETLQALKEAGYTLGVASNRTQSFTDQLGSLNLDGYFACAIAAGEVKSWKPDPGIFLHALRELGAKPEKTLYVGDNYYADVVGAQRAGLHPVLVDPEGLFPEADCPVINTLGDLNEILIK